MFEGKFPSRPFEGPASASETEGESLRAITWGDLRAALDAARDLRSGLPCPDETDVASFDVPAARRIAALGDGKDRINPDDLANGKGTCTNDAASHDAHPGRDLRI